MEGAMPEAEAEKLLLNGPLDFCNSDSGLNNLRKNVKIFVNKPSTQEEN